MNKKLTLCIVHKDSQVLLGMKKRGFGAGKWNGFGGKVEVGESIEEAARREMLEEASIQLGKLEKLGILDFTFNGDPQILEVHVFRATEYSGTPTESGEMKPQWFQVNEIPFHEMWLDDIFWFPLFLEGKKFKGKFLFGKQNEEEVILEHELTEVAEL